jgi:HSP20 family molecular chaperone IbpA
MGGTKLPVGINTGSVTADLKDGVLEIVARKIAPAAEKPRQEEAKSAPFKTQPQKDRSAAA